MNKSETAIRPPRARTLLLIALMLVFAGGALMVWLPYHHEQRAIAGLESVGAAAETAIVRPRWVPGWMDEKHLKVFSRVIKITFADPSLPLPDSALQHLDHLAHVKTVRFDDTQITDAGMKHLGRLTNLESVYLIDTPISDEGLRHLRACFQIQQSAAANRRDISWIMLMCTIASLDATVRS